MNPNTQTLREFDIQRGMDCILWLETGGLMLRDCEISYNSIPTGIKSRMVAIVAQPNTRLNLTTCKIIGSQTGHCGGIVMLNAFAHISDCEAQYLHAGCFYSICKPYHVVTIQDCILRDSKVCGVYC
jgi:hypothetical protein